MENTLERIKINGYNYKYFIADFDGNEIKSFDDSYSDAIEIGRHEVKAENDNLDFEFVPTRIFYQFTVVDKKYRNVYINGVSIKEQDISKFNLDGVSLDDLDVGTFLLNGYIFFVEEKEFYETKCIIDNNGSVLYKYFHKVVEFIPDIGFILKISISKYCFIDINGKCLIKSNRKFIKYIKEHSLFQVGDEALYDVNGVLQPFQLEHRFWNRSLRKRNEYEKSNLLVWDNSNTCCGLLRNGQFVLEIKFDKIFLTDIQELLIVSFEEKLGFVWIIENEENNKKLIQHHFLTELAYDVIVCLNNGSFICKNFDLNEIDIILNFDFTNKMPFPIIRKAHTNDDYQIIKELNEQFGELQEIYMTKRIF